jgi:hypothetical protein
MPKRQQHRVNIVVTAEQAALLKDLASLDPTTRSPAGFVRQLVDQVTPLLRKTVPLMRAASEELATNREALRVPLREFLDEMDQLDLLDETPPHGAPRPERRSREDGRTARRRPRANSQGQ